MSNRPINNKLYTYLIKQYHIQLVQYYTRAVTLPTL